MTNLSDIEAATKKFADAHASLAGLVQELQEQIELVKRARLPFIKRAVARAAEHHTALKNLIEGAPDLFVRPRTVVFHGVKVGLAKGKGGIAFEDADRVVQLIKRHFPDRAEDLIRTAEAPDKEAIEKLDVAELKKIGCNVKDSGDQVVIKPTDSEVDKAVKALLKGAIDDASAEAA